MTTHELNLTVVGWLGSDPIHYPGADGATPYTRFRLASTRRRRDSATGEWTDGATEWFTVKAFRALAINASRSFRKGDPVVVTGRLSTEEWTSKEETTGRALILEATAVGPDLNFGESRFIRTVHAGNGSTAGQGESAEESGQAEGGAGGADVAGSDGTSDGAAERSAEPALAS